MKIPIFTDDAGWQGNQLKLAFAKRGVETTFVSLQDCVINLAQQRPHIEIPHFDINPPAAFVRGVAGGTLPQVITRLNVLHMLTMQGVRIYNQVRAIERTVDKAMTSFLLREHDVMTPATWACESRSQAEMVREQAQKNHQQLVLKPLFGSQGQGVRQLSVQETLPVPMQQYVDGVYYFQEFIETADAPHDYRVFVVSGRVISTMRRHGSGFVNNVAAGGRCEAVQANDAMIEIALKAAKAVDIDYCGVDVIQAVTGEYFVLEVNSIPAWRGLQSVTDFNIAEVLVDDFLRKID
ncbi:RimK family alpha-L-glutamate ligase [Methylotenera sp.]|uniref:ATP-grasp domain-containing protein n=1 Tax=Methylotenera sp. TaxID=2051956 RepID=UPI0027355246|nr:RimK family alpha-L-glutamate ligase [Methylotenera sp.]MDP3210409.1 RimK family alpha-L-glutamate ligase [Methylotenera sp.]MDP3776751.1 RimK family alpha-L-glutamate ligase [Methylotenera sp.]